jgi:hypothetical protein
MLQVNHWLLVPALLSVSLVAAAPARAEGPTKMECIAANSSAQDLRPAGKLLEARDKLRLCVSEACPGPVREDCAQRLDEVGKAVPSIAFEVKDAAGNDVAGVQITMDGQPAGAAGSAIQLDPGEHTFTFEAQGLPRTEKKLVIVEGVKERHDLVVMGGNGAGGVPGPSAPASPTPGAARPIETPIPHASGLPTLSWVAFGVGGAGLAAGIVAGLVAGSKHSALSGECNTSAGTCAPQYAGDLDAFHTWRTLSTVGYVVGAFGAAGGVALWLLGPEPAQSGPSAQVWISPGGAGIAGRF